MSIVDLHMHTFFSTDGEFSPETLIGLCSQANLRLIAVTDHNCVRGIAPAMEAAKLAGIRLIPGTELDCILDGIYLHLLGYGIDWTDRRFKELEEDVLAQERKKSGRMLEFAHRELGLQFNDEVCLELAHDGIITGEIIGETALSDSRNLENPILTPYRAGGNRSDNPFVNFYWDYFSQGTPGFIPTHYISFHEANRLILETGGFSVLAHPAITVGRDEARIRQMAEAGMRGMEVYSSYHSPEDLEYFGGLADQIGLLKTIGSDFHGKTKPAVRLGFRDGDFGQDGLYRLLSQEFFPGEPAEP